MNKGKSEKVEQDFGSYIANLRQVSGYTLRQVEELTKNAVSNAYLSQLEHGKVKQPSPNVIYSLSTAYKVDYSTLMAKAGYFIAGSTDPNHAGADQSIQSAFADITKDEEKQLREYLEFLRSKKKS